jgi:sporulation integral membrane protein YlbJ
MKKILYTLFFVLLIALILTHSTTALSLAADGLNLWFTKMIPALFPFMILSGMMVGMGLTENFSIVLYPVLRPLFHVRKNVCYAIIMGFLCGFPMGAKVSADLLEHKLITRQEASYLLAFCNNIGPVYFCGFVLPLLGRREVWPYLFGMYGIPLIYGIILRYTLYRSIGYTTSPRHKAAHTSRFCPIHITHHHITGSTALHSYFSTLQSTQLAELHATGTDTVPSSQASPTKRTFLSQCDESIRSAIQSILMLGGYMILFNIMNLIPLILLGSNSPWLPRIAPLLEINRGLALLGASMPLYSLLLLPFGGLSCIAQTYSMIKKCDLPISSYVYHKLFLSLLTAGYYICWYMMSSSTFLQ